jgi:hypothetical protein
MSGTADSQAMSNHCVGGGPLQGLTSAVQPSVCDLFRVSPLGVDGLCPASFCNKMLA